MSKKESKKGATSSHTAAAKVNVLQHNRRDFGPANADPARTHFNEFWESERIKKYKSTRYLIRAAERLYSSRTGQKVQKSFSPLRETVVVCKEETTLEQAKELAWRDAALTGMQPLGVWIHRDEGSSRSQFNHDVPFKGNYHIHILWDAQDHDTGKTIKLTKRQLQRMQDMAAECLGMPRGNPAIETGKKHIAAAEKKILKMDAELEDIKAEIDDCKDTKAKAKMFDAYMPIFIQYYEAQGYKEIEHVTDATIEGNNVRCRMNGERQSYKMSKDKRYIAEYAKKTKADMTKIARGFLRFTPEFMEKWRQLMSSTSAKPTLHR